MSENVNFHMTFPPTPAYIGRLLKKSAHIFSMQVTWGCLILRILRELLLVKSYI